MTGRGAQGAQSGNNPAKAGTGGGDAKQLQLKGHQQRFILRTKFEGCCSKLKGHLHNLKIS